MRTLKIEIDLGNAAFGPFAESEVEEVNKILAHLSLYLRHHWIPDDTAEVCRLWDSNGNIVGKVHVNGEKRPVED